MFKGAYNVELAIRLSPAEKFSAARLILMAPLGGDEAQVFAGAFVVCLLGLDSLTDSMRDANAARWVRTIRESLNTGDDPTKDAWVQKVQQMTYEEKDRCSTAIDSLADWLRDACIRGA